MTHARVGRGATPGGGAVTFAIVHVAEEGAALGHTLLGLVGVAGVVAGLRSLRVVAGRFELVPRVDVGPVEVAHPVPDIPTHVVEAVAIGRIGLHRRSAREAVLLGVLVREGAGPGIGHEFASRLELLAPRKAFALQPAARGDFPLGLGRQPLARPPGVSHRIVPRHLHDGMLLASVELALRPLGMLPVRAGRPAPPRIHLAQIDRAIARREDK